MIFLTLFSFLALTCFTTGTYHNDAIYTANQLIEPFNASGIPPQQEIFPHLNRTKRDIEIKKEFPGYQEVNKLLERMYNHLWRLTLKAGEVKSNVKTGEKKLDRVLLRTGTFDVTNYGDTAIEAQSQTFQLTVTRTETLTVSNTYGISGALKLPIPLISNLTPTVQFSGQQTSTKTESVEESLTVSSQKVSLSPKSKKQVNYKVFRQETIESFNMAFKIDSSSKFSYWSPFTRIPHLYTHEVLKQIKFLYKKGYKLKESQYTDYNYDANELIFKNFVATRSYYNDEVVVTVGKEEPISA